MWYYPNSTRAEFSKWSTRRDVGRSLGILRVNIFSCVVVGMWEHWQTTGSYVIRSFASRSTTSSWPACKRAAHVWCTSWLSKKSIMSTTRLGVKFATTTRKEFSGSVSTAWFLGDSFLFYVVQEGSSMRTRGISWSRWKQARWALGAVWIILLTFSRVAGQQLERLGITRRGGSILRS